MGTWIRKLFLAAFSTLTLFYVYIYRLSITHIVKYPFVYQVYYPLIPGESPNLDNATFRQSYLNNLRFLVNHLGDDNNHPYRTSSFTPGNGPNTTVSNLTIQARVKETNFTMDNETRKEFIPLLTLFTTWPKDEKKFIVRNNTIKNWSHFKPLIRPVFFGSNASHTRALTRNGWDFRNVPKTSLGVPILKYMFLDVLSNYKSLYYGYANGDILFTDELVETLLAIARRGSYNDKPFLIIGKRTNVDNVTVSEVNSVSNVSKAAKQRGHLFRGDAEDYFITDASYPWEDIPGVVIGRIAYDNWLVMNSRKLKHNVIDATATLTAVHQTTSAGNFEGSKHNHTDYNSKLLSKLYKNSIRYVAGVTDCAPFTTQYHGVDIHIIPRKRFHPICYIP